MNTQQNFLLQHLVITFLLFTSSSIQFTVKHMKLDGKKLASTWSASLYLFVSDNSFDAHYLDSNTHE